MGRQLCMHGSFLNRWSLGRGNGLAYTDEAAGRATESIVFHNHSRGHRRTQRRPAMEYVGIDVHKIKARIEQSACCFITSMPYHERLSGRCFLLKILPRSALECSRNHSINS
jgi:hypothetical protein